MKLFKKISIFMLSLATIFLIVGCSAKKVDPEKDNWTTYEKNKTITIGFDNTFVPMGFKDKDGKDVGFDIDLAEAVFNKYGIKVKWQPINWDLKETELTKGNIDLIWNGYSATDERRSKVLFTDSYMENDQVLVTKKSSNINSAKDMAGKILGAQAGSSGYDVFTKQKDILKNVVKNNDANQYETFNEALIDLKNDRINGLLIDRVYANYYLQKEGVLEDYNILVVGYESESFAVGARLNDKTLVQNINKAFKELYKENKFQEISKKWFAKDVATKNIK